MNDLDPKKHLVPLYTKEKELLGVYISPELWALAEDRILGTVSPFFKKDEPLEPIKDWEQLKSCWGFQYPVDLDVTCENCGNETSEWEKDEPRRFRLRAANLGGLVTFQCMECKAKILKRHFKKEIQVECKPHQESKSEIFEPLTGETVA